MKKTLISLATIAALGLASTSASAVVFNDFQVDPNYDGDLNNAFTADKITGGYVEAIVFDSANQTFDVRLRWSAGQFYANEGSNILAPGVSGTNVSQLYALYEGSGTFSTSGSVTTFVTNAGSGSLSLYLDAGWDTTFDFVIPDVTYDNIFDLTMGAADQLVASGIPQAGSGSLDPSLSTCDPGINCGSFGTSATLALTAFGQTYFIDPVPFYNLSFQSGQLNNFDVAGEQVINGSMDVVFQTPEPASLALLGLGLVGLGAVRRRKM